MWLGRCGSGGKWPVSSHTTHGVWCFNPGGAGLHVCGQPSAHIISHALHADLLLLFHVSHVT